MSNRSNGVKFLLGGKYFAENLSGMSCLILSTCNRKLVAGVLSNVIIKGKNPGFSLRLSRMILPDKSSCLH